MFELADQYEDYWTLYSIIWLLAPCSILNSFFFYKLFSSIGFTLQIKKHFKDIGVPADLKYIDPTYMVRACRANASDAILCTVLGQNAVSWFLWLSASNHLNVSVIFLSILISSNLRKLYECFFRYMEPLLGSVASRQVFAIHTTSTFPFQRSSQRQSMWTLIAGCGTAAWRPLGSPTSTDSTLPSQQRTVPRESSIMYC